MVRKSYKMMDLLVEAFGDVKDICVRESELYANYSKLTFIQ